MFLKLTRLLYLVAGDVDNNRLKLDLDHVVSDTFKVQVFNGSWLSDHEIVYVDQNGSIVVFDADTNTSSSILVRTYDKTLHTMAAFKLSPDRQSILFVSDRRQEFGAPISSRYAIFNISTQTVEFLDDLVRVNYPSIVQPHIQYAAWGASSNSIVFIESNDIYYIPDFSNAAAGKYTRLTNRQTSTREGQSQASESLISNGIPDSLYRANIFRDVDSAAVWPSSDGRHLAYLSFDDSMVEPTPIEVYDSGSGDADQAGAYPSIHMERYPRAGAINPRVSLHVVDLKSESPAYSISQLPPPSELLRQQQADPRLSHYITYVGWLPAPHDSQLLVMWANRAQNSSWLTVCEAKAELGWTCDIACAFTTRMPPTSSPKRQTILPAFGSDGTRLLFVVLPRPDSVIGDHSHVAMLRGQERAPKYLTHGQFDVDRLVGYDSQTDSLYFEAGVSELAERHLYQIVHINQPAMRQTNCVSCRLVEAETCSYNYAHIAPGARYLVHECLGPSIPSTRMRLLKEVDSGSDFNETNFMMSRYVLNTNEYLEKALRSKQMPIEKFIAIKTSAGGPIGGASGANSAAYDIHIKLYLPNEIEEEKDKRFPLLIESSEIDRRQVWKKFDLDWGKYLASRKQLIYAKIDCVRTTAGVSPGSGGASAWADSSYLARSFGSAGGSGEVDQAVLAEPLFNAKDQAEVIKFLAENVDLFPYIDRRRIAIWGPSSTSAYLALATTSLDDAKLIHCTIAVAPITNWRYMSSFVAERYLGLPWIESNSLKYERANLLKRAYEFSTRKLLVVHGTADEQVHVQHSMKFIKSLTEHIAPSLASSAPVAGQLGAGAIHQMQLYPDVGHSLDQVKRHYYMTLDGFVDRCFYQKPIAIKATEWKGKVRPKLY